MIFRLTPTDVESVHWHGSTFKGEVIVRAESEEQARDKARSSFVIAQDARLTRDSPESVWHSRELVTCKVVDDWEGETDGEAAILYPPEAVALAD